MNADVGWHCVGLDIRGAYQIGKQLAQVACRILVFDHERDRDNGSG